jgi:predicted acyl esterase
MPIRPGQTQLALVPPYEKWALEILTRTDYDDYWMRPSVNPHLHSDRFPDMPILLLAGWYDSYTQGTFQSFVGLGAGRCAPWSARGPTGPRPWSSPTRVPSASSEARFARAKASAPQPKARRCARWEITPGKRALSCPGAPTPRPGAGP